MGLAMRPKQRQSSMTCRGFTANKAATRKLGHAALVQNWSSRNSKTLLAIWKKRFVKCGPTGSNPKI